MAFGPVVAAALLLLPAREAQAAPVAPADAKGRQGLVLAKRGDCAKAVPLLEEAEEAKHRPSVANALAGCYVKKGELVRASDIYHALAQEKVTRTFTRDDKAAVWAAKKKAAQLDARIPTITFEAAERYEELKVEVAGTPVADLTEPKKVDPKAKILITARAKGRKPMEETVELKEKEKRVFKVRLEVAPVVQAPKKDDEKTPSTLWLGARFHGLVIPKFMMNVFGEGGATVFVPGGDLTLTKVTSVADLVVSLGYSSYRMGEVPFKLNERPNTEYEILESDLQAITAALDVIWNIRLDSAGRFNLRLGAGVGVGWMFAGELYRTQAYPTRGSPDDPASYVKCQGPNAPAGTFRYCNQLDKDADHYNGYGEPSWFQGGARPLIYPWVALPEVGFAWRVAPRVTVDLNLAFTISGAFGSVGARYGL